MLKASKAIFISIALLPLLGGLLYSLLYSLGVLGIVSSGFTFQHWIAVFSQVSIWQSIAFSLLQAVVGLAISVVFALCFFLLFTEKNKQNFPPTYLFIPLAMAPVAVGFTFFSFWSGAGLVSRIFFQMGITSSLQNFPNVAQGSWGIGILLAHIFLGIPFFIISFFNIYKAHKISDLSVLAQSMGLSKKSSAFKVIVPILLNQSIRQMLLYFVFFFGAYEIPLLLGSESNRMFSILILDKLTKFDIGQKPQAFVMTTAYLFTIVMAFVVLAFPKKMAK